MARSYYDEVKADNPLAYWRFHDTGATVADLSGNSKLLTYTGTPLKNQPGLLGDGNGAMDCNAAGAAYRASDFQLEFEWTDPFSLELLIKIASAPAAARILLSKWAAARFSYYLTILDTGAVKIQRYDGTHNPAATSPSSICDGVKHHVVVRGGDGTLSLYVDGVLANSTSDTATGSLANAENIVVGDVNLSGLIDEVAIYDTALSAGRILAHYLAASHPGNLIATVEGTAAVCDKASVLISEALDGLGKTGTARLQTSTIQEGNAIVVTFGTSPTQETLFSGRVVGRTVEQPRLADPIWTTVAAEDLTRDLNRRLVYDSAQSYCANSFVTRMVASCTTSFTTTHVDAAVASPVTLSYAGRLPGEIGAEIARTVGAVFEVDAARDVHFYVPPETGVTQPTTLTAASVTLRDWAHERSLNQIRSRVMVRGRRCSIVADLAPGQKALAFSGESIFEDLQHDADYNYVQVQCGPLIADFDRGNTTPVRYSVTSTGMNPGDTQVAVNSPYKTLGPFWAQIGGQYLYCASATIPDSPWAGVYKGIPSSGPGAAVVFIEAGSDIIYPAQIPFQTTVNSHFIPSGTDAAIFMTRTSDATRSVIATREGGDGLVDCLVDDDTLNYEATIARADAELAIAGVLEETIRYTTEDANSHPGRQIGVSSINSVTGVFTIQTVQVSFSPERRKPQRDVVAASNRKLTLVDLLRTIAGKARV